MPNSSKKFIQMMKQKLACNDGRYFFKEPLGIPMMDYIEKKEMPITEDEKMICNFDQRFSDLMDDIRQSELTDTDKIFIRIEILKQTICDLSLIEKLGAITFLKKHVLLEAK